MQGKQDPSQLAETHQGVLGAEGTVVPLINSPRIALVDQRFCICFVNSRVDLRHPHVPRWRNLHLYAPRRCKGGSGERTSQGRRNTCLRTARAPRPTQGSSGRGKALLIRDQPLVSHWLNTKLQATGLTPRNEASRTNKKTNWNRQQQPHCTVQERQPVQVYSRQVREETNRTTTVITKYTRCKNQ